MVFLELPKAFGSIYINLIFIDDKWDLVWVQYCWGTDSLKDQYDPFFGEHNMELKYLIPQFNSGVRLSFHNTRSCIQLRTLHNRWYVQYEKLGRALPSDLAKPFSIFFNSSGLSIYLTFIYFLCISECGSLVNNSLISPGYPNPGTEELNCVYEIPIPYYEAMEIYFEDFDVGNSWGHWCG